MNPSPSLDDIARHAEALLRQGRNHEAVALLTAQPRLNAQGMDRLCEAYVQLRDWAKAQAVNAALLRHGAARAFHFRMECVILANGGQRALALEKARAYLDRHGEDAAMLGVAKQCCSELGDQAGALRYGQRALDLKDRQAGTDTRPLHPNAAGQDVVAYSVWGTHQAYLLGAAINVRQVSEYLPGWTVRLYAASTLEPALLAHYRRLGAQVVVADVAHPQVPPYFWRFLVADDPGVRRFLCRDADGRIGPPENILVRQWLDSGKLFHVVRDDVTHDEPMLAGLWGGTACADLEMARNIGRYFNGRVENRYGHDQTFLAQHVWPRIKQSVHVHDRHYATAGVPSHAHGLPCRFGLGRQNEASVVREATARGLLPG